MRNRAVIILSVLSAFALAVGGSASGAQPRGGPYAPENWNSPPVVKAWVNMDASCPGIACHTFFKLERSSWSGWRYMGGRWISGQWGWNSVSADKLSGCYHYRAVAEVYTAKKAELLGRL